MTDTTQLPESVRGLKPRDTFIFEFGYSTVKAIVKSRNAYGYNITFSMWMKREDLFVPFERLEQDRQFMITKSYSKLKWFLKF